MEDGGAEQRLSLCERRMTMLSFVKMKMGERIESNRRAMLNATFIPASDSAGLFLHFRRL